MNPDVIRSRQMLAGQTAWSRPQLSEALAERDSVIAALKQANKEKDDVIAFLLQERLVANKHGTN